MAVHLRLRRMGAKKRPYYRIVAADSRRARDGRFLDIVGTYDPIKTPAEVKIVEDKIVKWLDQGAVPSDTVHSLLSQIGFNEKYYLSKRGKDVSDKEIGTTITERQKRTRKIKKAELAEAEEAKAKAEAEAKAADEEKPAEETKEEGSSEGGEEEKKE